MPRYNVHGTPHILDGETVFEAADPTIIITLTAESDSEAQRVANMLCGMDVQEIECAECSMSLEDCGCGGPDYNVVDNHCPECGQYDRECECDECECICLDLDAESQGTVIDPECPACNWHYCLCEYCTSDHGVSQGISFDMGSGRRFLNFGVTYCDRMSLAFAAEKALTVFSCESLLEQSA